MDRTTALCWYACKSACCARFILLLPPDHRCGLSSFILGRRPSTKPVRTATVLASPSRIMRVAAICCSLISTLSIELMRLASRRYFSGATMVSISVFIHRLTIRVRRVTPPLLRALVRSVKVF